MSSCKWLVHSFAMALACVLLPTATARAAGAGGFLPAGPAEHMPLVGPATPQFEPGRLIVKLRSGVPASSLVPPPIRTLDHQISLDVWLVAVPAGREVAIAHAWSALPGVEYAEPDWIRHAMATEPNDPLYASEQWFLPHVNAPSAWGVSTGSSSTIIAIVDTGVDSGHPDLSDKLLPGTHFGDNSPGSDDLAGHGTHVAGLAAASTNNAVGVAGADWGARLLPVRVLTEGGTGGDDAISAGIAWAVSNGARIINLSLGGAGYGETLGRAVKSAHDAGALIVTAAGNDYFAGDPVEYPAAYPEAMAIGATDDRDNRASYSETGAYVSVVAPGGDPTDSADPIVSHWITSTYPIALGSYTQLAGTSQAAAIVAGLAGLVWSVDPGLTNDQVRGIIENSAFLPGGGGRTDALGHGRIDMAAALREAQAMTYLPGDVNGDGRITGADALEALRIVLGLDPTTPALVRQADVSPPPNGDGHVTLQDVQQILRWAVGLDPLPPRRS